MTHGAESDFDDFREIDPPWWDKYRNLIWIFVIVFAAGGAWAQAWTVRVTVERNTGIIAQHEERIRQLEMNMTELRTDVKYIRNSVEQINKWARRDIGEGK